MRRDFYLKEKMRIVGTHAADGSAAPCMSAFKVGAAACFDPALLDLADAALRMVFSVGFWNQIALFYADCNTIAS